MYTKYWDWMRRNGVEVLKRMDRAEINLSDTRWISRVQDGDGVVYDLLEGNLNGWTGIAMVPAQ